MYMVENPKVKNLHIQCAIWKRTEKKKESKCSYGVKEQLREHSFFFFATTICISTLLVSARSVRALKAAEEKLSAYMCPSIHPLPERVLRKVDL
jgi:hypothetical protein